MPSSESKVVYENEQVKINGREWDDDYNFYRELVYIHQGIEYLFYDEVYYKNN